MAKTVNPGADRVLWMDQDRKVHSKVRSGFRKSNLWVFVLPMLLLIGSCLFFVWSRIQVIQLGYEISNALKERKGLGETNKKWRIEIARLKSYARIERMAAEELKMSKPKPDQVIVIR